MAADPPERLARRLGVVDAVVLGLASMLGAGVFAAAGPAAAEAGAGILLALLVAGGVAWCNAHASARLAADTPTSGGAYAHGRRLLGPPWGFLAGWGFVVGKAASCAAIAMAFGAYAAPDWQRPAALAAIVAVTGVNLAGVRRTAGASRVLVAVVVACLVVAVVACAAGGEASVATVGSPFDAAPGSVVRAAGLLFFAFAGYARIATLGEEVVDPDRTIPIAIPVALLGAIALYAVVFGTVLAVLGPAGVAGSEAPVADAVAAGSLDGLRPVVAVGAVAATLGVLVSLLAGVARTAFAMAGDGELPAPLAAVSASTRVPHVAQIAVGVVAAALVAVFDFAGAVGFSSFCVLTYYAVANSAALRLRDGRERVGRPMAAVGLAGCVALAVLLPGGTVVAGAVVLAVGLVGRAVLARR